MKDSVDIQRVVVVGAGAIGGWLAAALAGADHSAERTEALIAAMLTDPDVRLPGERRVRLAAAAARDGVDVPDSVLTPLRELADSHELLVTIEENSIMGGAGSAVSEFLASENLLKPMLHLGLPDYYVEHAKPTQMLAECGLDAAGIEAAVRERLACL